MDFIDSDFSLAENLRTLRRRLKWSQEELAEKIGLNRGNIASYENGTAEPKICNLVKFAHLFNISVFDLTHADLKNDDAYSAATLRHQNGFLYTGIPSIDHFVKEAEDYEQAIKGLHCLFRLKTKNMEDLAESLHFAKDQFEQLFGVTEQLLNAHLELIAVVKEKCNESNK